MQTKEQTKWKDASDIVDCAKEAIRLNDAAKAPGSTPEAYKARKAAIMPMLKAREELITIVWDRVYLNAKAEKNPTAFILDMTKKIRIIAGEDQWQQHALSSLTNATKQDGCPPNLKLTLEKEISDRIDRKLSAESKLLGSLEKVLNFVDGQCGSPVAKYYANLRQNAGRGRD